MLIATPARGAGEGWYHPASEVHHVVFAADGSVASHRQLTDGDPECPHWLPSIEHWNARRPGDVAGGHWYTWTAGRSAGWMDAPGYEDTLKTQVWLGRL